MLDENYFGINSIVAKGNGKFCENEKVYAILGVWFIAISSCFDGSTLNSLLIKPANWFEINAQHPLIPERKYM